MKINDIIHNTSFKVCSYNGTNCTVNNILCTDLHSYALKKLSENDIWITIIPHINTLAVAFQKKIACIIIADAEKIPEDIKKAADQHNITVLASPYPVYQTALILHKIETDTENNTQ